VSTGSLTASLVHPRETFKAAVRESAAAVIFVHNHPSGDARPSQEDIALTRRLVQAGDLLGIRSSTTSSSATADTTVSATRGLIAPAP